MKRTALATALLCVAAILVSCAVQEPDLPDIPQGAALASPTHSPPPTAAPTATEAPKDPMAGITKELAEVLAAEVLFGMHECFITMEGYTPPDYLVDNADTHLALRYVDFWQEDINRSRDQRKRLHSVEPVRCAVREWEERPEDGYVHCVLVCEVRYDRYDHKIGGIIQDVTMRLAPGENGPEIILLDLLLGDTQLKYYVEMEANIQNGGEITIELVDAVVDQQKAVILGD